MQPLRLPLLLRRGAAAAVNAPAPHDGLPGPAYALVVATTVVASGLVATIVRGTTPTTRDAVVFVALLAGASLAHTFVVVTTRNQAYHSSIAFLLAAVVLLPPGLVAVIAIAQHIPEWIRERYAWYIQTFNIANYALSVLAASSVFGAVRGGADADSLPFALAAASAAITFVVLNHGLLAVMLRLARGHSFADTRLFALDSLSTDLLLASVGCSIAGALAWNPWFAVFALAPLWLIHRSLTVPRLLAEARTDAKTGLANARHFSETLQENIDRAIRTERPLSLLLVDLDFLREVNNRHGHIAGDAVLREVAGILRSEVRSYDLPARFGGEEFAVVLPETSREEAAAIAERMRRKVAELQVAVPTSPAPVGVSVSVGVAEFPRNAASAEELVHAADVAMYAAKNAGRNRVVTSTDVVPSLQLV